jgi:hypothetical protein
MIHFFTTDHHRYTIEDFIESWMPDGKTLIDAVSYEKWSVWREFPASVCIFTDLERLLPFETPMVRDLADALLIDPKKYTILNQPGSYSGRFNLLKKLHAAGVNQFDAVRFTDDFSSLRYPVFIRNEKDHKGPITELLNSRSELDAAVEKLRESNVDQRHLIVVEYCDCSEADGFFRKYSAVNVGGKLVPRHVLFSTDWATKTADVVNEASLIEEKAFVENFPHGEQVTEAFRLAGVEYGRIDYGVHEGRVQVWEINTNPVIVPKREKIDERRMATQTESARQIAEAFRELAKKHEPEPAYPFRTPIFFFHQIELQFSRLYRQAKYGRRP